MNDELLIKFLLDESNPQENDEVNQWLASDKKNQAYFEQLQKIWNESEKLSIKNEVDEELAWTKFKSRINAKPPVKLKIWNTPLRIAVAVVLVISSWALYYAVKTSGYTDVNANEQVLSKMLPDGSELTLNKFSHIKFANNFKSNRSIRLDSGDVFFKVAKDKTKPFIIEIDKIAVEVVGTSFNIKHLKKQTEVVVETGIVKVSLGTSTVLLHKGEKVIISTSAVKLDKAPVKDQLYTYYRTNLFIADNTPLPILVAILNEAYGAKVSVDESAKQVIITTTLPYRKSLIENLGTICATIDKLKIKRNQNEIILSY